MASINWKCYLIVGWLLLLEIRPALAQPSSRVPDSLAHYLKIAPLDTSYLRVANQYVWWLIHPLDQWARADSLLDRMEVLAKQVNDPLNLQRTYWYHGVLSLRLLRNNKASIYFKQAHRLVIRHHQGPAELQRVLWGIGGAYYSVNQYETALRYYLAAISLTEKYELTNYITRAYIDAGRIMAVMHRHKESLLYWQKAYALAPREQDKSMLWFTEYYMAECLNSTNKPEAALKHLEQALLYLNQYESKQSKSSLLTTIGLQYMKLKRPNQAIVYLREAQKLADQIGNSTRKMDAYRNLGLFYQQQKAYRQAEYYFGKAIGFAHKTNNAIETRNVTQDLVQMYAQAHQYINAYHYQLVVNQLNDSVFSSQAALKTRDILIQHENEKKEAHIRLLNEQNQRTQLQRNALLVGTLLSIALAVAVAAWLLNRARLRRLEEAQQLRQQIANDLHDDMGSALSSISLLSSMSNDLLHQSGPAMETPELVQRMVAKIFTDTRQMQETIDELIWMVKPGDDSLTQIAARIRAYAEPLLESKGTRFQFVFDPALERQPVSLAIRRNLYLLGKEAINNSVKYAQATQVTLLFDYQHEKLTVLIDDNGRGFDPATPTTRTGLQSMDQRAKAMGGTLTIRSAPGQGTSLKLSVAV